jgi:tetratricopeptide (TPR) repeat protein
MMRELCNYSAGRYGAVVEAHKKTAAIDPSFVYIQSWAAASLRELGDYPGALKEYETAAKGLRGFPQYGLALTYLRMGRADDARKIMRDLDDLAAKRYVPFYMRAAVHSALGDADTAVALFGQAMDKREGIFLAVHALPEMAALAKDPRTRRYFEQAEAFKRLDR